MGHGVAQLLELGGALLHVLGVFLHGVRVASAAVDVVWRPPSLPGVPLVAGLCVAFGVAVVLVADRLERLFVRAILLARWADRRGHRWLGGSLKRLLRRLVAGSYRGALSPLGVGQRTPWHLALHRAFLTLHSSDAHYPRPRQLLERRPARRAVAGCCRDRRFRPRRRVAALRGLQRGLVRA